MAPSYDWHFPLPRTHTGMLLGNGVMGAMVWGEGNILRITVGRADLWDHRGGLPWTDKMSYANIRACLEQGDEPGLRALFERTPSDIPVGRREADPGPGTKLVGGTFDPARPSVIPIGRLEIDLGPGAELVGGTLDLGVGAIKISLERDGKPAAIELTMDMAAPVVVLRFAGPASPAAIKQVTAWDYVGEHLTKIGFAEPAAIAEPELEGWTQELPADPALGVGYRQAGDCLYLAAARGNDAADAASQAKNVVAAAEQRGFEGIGADNAAWWANYWQGVPRVGVPNERLSFMYYYGMYKFAGLTKPGAVAATLQGPWIEEYQMPPWSSDYHFNINVQLCYQPAYHGNCLEHLEPLWDLIDSWQETLRHNAKAFLGIDDGVMLPHAVDDRCTCMGGFWTGSVDHGCTAWVALMMFRYYRYTMKADFLRQTAWPFMRAAMRVYEEMLEPDGDGYALPISVSPEYRGASMNAWGRNASFQLACIHALAEALLQAAEALGETPAPAWADILEKLPKACAIGDPAAPEIALWEGTPLEESHRHHSHLAGITPFDIFDFEDESCRGLLERSVARWVLRGPGLWSGWCVPWAAMIHTRFGNAEMAEQLVEATQRFFTNEGHGTLHDASAPGFTMMGIRATSKALGRQEIMQMDAGMAAAAAVQEMLLHTRRGVNYLFAGAPVEWPHASFGPMRTDGGFLVAADRQRSHTTRVEVESPYGGCFRLKNPWDTAALVESGGASQTIAGDILEIPTQPGDRLVFTAAP